MHLYKGTAASVTGPGCVPRVGWTGTDSVGVRAGACILRWGRCGGGIRGFAGRGICGGG